MILRKFIAFLKRVLQKSFHGTNLVLDILAIIGFFFIQRASDLRFSLRLTAIYLVFITFFSAFKVWEEEVQAREEVQKQLDNISNAKPNYVFEGIGTRDLPRAMDAEKRIEQCRKFAEEELEILGYMGSNVGFPANLLMKHYDFINDSSIDKSELTIYRDNLEKYLKDLDELEKNLNYFSSINIWIKNIGRTSDSDMKIKIYPKDKNQCKIYPSINSAFPFIPVRPDKKQRFKKSEKYPELENHSRSAIKFPQGFESKVYLNMITTTIPKLVSGDSLELTDRTFWICSKDELAQLEAKIISEKLNGEVFLDINFPMNDLLNHS